MSRATEYLATPRDPKVGARFLTPTSYRAGHMGFDVAECAAMSPDSSTLPEDQSFAEERQRIERFYNEQFLPTNPWSTIKPCPYLYLRQRQRRMRETLIECGIDTPDKLRGIDVLDVGSGGGTNIAWLIELGADPAHCTGIDLLPKRVETARARLPNVRWIEGDVTCTDAGGPFDLVMLVAVLTSVTYTPLKQRIVDRCFSMLKPGGVLFFYDLMTVREKRGSKDYKLLTYDEMDGYFGGRRTRWFKRDLLKASIADRIVGRYGITAAELIQASGLFNTEAAFAYVRT
jgi:2-polyprenyl-3-methyl-5-hydroxy-6-metoxy-1,4-benzoquinol methylase